MTEMDRRDYVQSIERALLVINAFTDTGPLLSLSALATSTGLSRPTVRRILLTLQQLGYVRAEGTAYGLTPRVLALGYAYLSSLNLPALAQPVMEALTEELGEGTSLATLDQTEVVYINRVQRHRITSINLAVGTRLPAHATSMGHVLLADLGPQALERYFAAAQLRALTERTLTSRSALVERFELVRRRGWAAVDQELEIGRRSAAAPVRDAGGKVVAALSLSSGTSDRSMADLIDTCVPALVAAAGKISAALGDGGYAMRGARPAAPA
jgi:IclR family transcriptional regulator, pca regulon regulatory protein